MNTDDIEIANPCFPCQVSWDSRPCAGICDARNAFDRLIAENERLTMALKLACDDVNTDKMPWSVMDGEDTNRYFLAEADRIIAEKEAQG